jgi:hypothetical protein
VVLKLCGGKNPDVAVSLFASDSPLERRYVRMQEIDAMNTLGGPSSGDKLVFDEEVIMLDGSSPSPSELSVSGANGHHVLRLDGTCATVMDDELTATRPPAPRYAQLTWGHLDASIQDALLVDPNVKAKRRAFRTACYASFRPRADPRCDNARQALADAVVKAIHAPISLPDVMVNAM